MKVIFAHFDISKYGGIVEEVENRALAFKQLGWEVDIIRITFNQNESENNYNRKLSEMESGVFDKKVAFHSQNKGYEKSKITGYWKNSYYGWLLPPFTNLIPCKHEHGLDYWNNAVSDADLIFWSFMPTKKNGNEGLSDWWKYFDLPKRIKQVFIVHDGYFDIRSGWIATLAKKISFLDCVHLASYGCCANIAIPRKLTLSPRVFPDHMFQRVKSEREIDFFSAHLFRTHKRMEDLIRSIPYLKGEYVIAVGGNDVEYSIMTSKDKCTPNYYSSKKYDPDLSDSEVGKKIWDRAVEQGMIYTGLLPKSEMDTFQQNSKFFIDPSHSPHYAEYNRTNINSSVIEGIINGCMPIIRDYKGLEKIKRYTDDAIFDSLKAIVIPWDATPKQFADYMIEASKIDDDTYYKNTMHNFNVFKRYSDAVQVTKEFIRLLYEDGLDELKVGENSQKVIELGEDVMNNFFKIETPIKWTTK